MVLTTMLSGLCFLLCIRIEHRADIMGRFSLKTAFSTPSHWIDNHFTPTNERLNVSTWEKRGKYISNPLWLYWHWKIFLYALLQDSNVFLKYNPNYRSVFALRNKKYQVLEKRVKLPETELSPLQLTLWSADIIVLISDKSFCNNFVAYSTNFHPRVILFLSIYICFYHEIHNLRKLPLKLWTFIAFSNKIRLLHMTLILWLFRRKTPIA